MAGATACVPARRMRIANECFHFPSCLGSCCLRLAVLGFRHRAGPKLNLAFPVHPSVKQIWLEVSRMERINLKETVEPRIDTDEHGFTSPWKRRPVHQRGERHLEKSIRNTMTKLRARTTKIWSAVTRHRFRRFGR